MLYLTSFIPHTLMAVDFGICDNKWSRVHECLCKNNHKNQLCCSNHPDQDGFRFEAGSSQGYFLMMSHEVIPCYHHIWLAH